MTVLIIDNYDSFVFNVARYCEEIGQTVIVKRNDAININEIKELAPNSIIISPGPATPQKAGISLDVIYEFQNKIPILGVCLGHQSIGEVFGGKTVNAKTPMHGRTSKIKHSGKNLFHELPNPLTVGRYHSLIVDQPSADLIIEATSEDGEIMAMSHKSMPIYGVQFHPESILSEHGHDLFNNFFKLVSIWDKSQT